MLKQTNKKRITVKVNDLVLLYVDPVDRGKSAPNNLLCYVVEQKHDKFKLACSVGILERLYSFNSFRKTDLRTNFSLENVPKKDPNFKNVNDKLQKFIFCFYFFKKSYVKVKNVFDKFQT